MIYLLLKLKNETERSMSRSKKHKYYCSNLFINKYIVNKGEFDNFKNFFKSHFVTHKKKFNSFAVSIVCKMNAKVTDKIKLPSSLIMEKK